MRRYLPSSTALKCFEASVRHLSFTKAAQELHLTQSAVSRQIRNLEDFLGRELFIRLNKRLVLTGSGAAYFKEVVPLLDGMENASLRVLHREDEKTVLTLATLPTLGSYWLVPRLAEFHRLYPAFQIKVKVLDSASNVEPDAVDVLLHYGGDNWPRAVSHHLMNEMVSPVCSPELLRQIGKHDWGPQDVTRFPLLHLSTRINAWPDWMEANEVIPHSYAGASFEHFHMLLSAAQAGMGVAIIPTIMLADALTSGTLVAPFGSPMKTPHEYFLSYPADKADLEQVVTFRDWLLGNLSA